MTALVRGVAHGVTPAGPDTDRDQCPTNRRDGYAPTCGHPEADHHNHLCPEENDVSEPVIGSQFSGHAGLDIAVQQVIGGRVAWHVENNATAAAVLAHNYPHVPNLGDITRVDWYTVDPIDVLVSGFPCTDISNAGHRAGIEGTQSGLWSYVADAARVLRPKLIVLENVDAILRRGIDRVIADLDQLGYVGAWTCLRASRSGAPHPRRRWFAIAWPAGSHPSRYGWHEGRPEHEGQLRGSDVAFLGDAVGWEEYEPTVRHWERVSGLTAPHPLTDTPRGPRLSVEFTEWVMGLPAGWVSSVPDLSRTKAIDVLGGGVVPQQGAAALRWLLTSTAKEGAA